MLWRFRLASLTRLDSIRFLRPMQQCQLTPVNDLISVRHTAKQLIDSTGCTDLHSVRLIVWLELESEFEAKRSKSLRQPLCACACASISHPLPHPCPHQLHTLHLFALHLTSHFAPIASVACTIDSNRIDSIQHDCGIAFHGITLTYSPRFAVLRVVPSRLVSSHFVI